MQHEKLIKTHRKLTILFTGLVFCIVCILGFSTLMAKYYNEQRMEKSEFRKSSDEIEKILESGNIVLKTFFLNQIQERRNFEERLKGEKEKQIGGKPFLSFFILDEHNDIVFENMVEKIDFGDLRIPNDEKIHSSSEALYRAMNLESQYGKKVIFYSRKHYDVDDFLRDVLILLGMTSLFSTLFYFLGYRFVERALRPVEENLQDMSDFIHNAGHELKTPLAVMRGNLQIMQAEGKLDEELVKKSLVQVDVINQLIESLRELSEIGSLSEKGKLNLSHELTSVCESLGIYAQEKQVSLENTIEKNFFLEANQQELSVLLSNIIKNALKYTPAGGKVHISLSKNVLTIQDSGIGMTQEEQEKIFERFYQGQNVRSKEGFGIGLSLVKKIADANHWKIEVKSDLGKGTSFYVIF